VPKKVELINYYLFIDTYKTYKIQIGKNEMSMNDGEMRMRCGVITECNVHYYY